MNVITLSVITIELHEGVGVEMKGGAPNGGR